MTVFGTQTPQVENSEYNTLQFVIAQALMKVQTIALCRVVACTNAGGIVPAGTVDVLPLVNQMTGDRIAVPHGTIYRLPYARIQGGANAIIIDPVAGDLCIVGFASRDISAVVAAKGVANPGSFRVFNWADGLYIAGVCNPAPTQYVVFAEGGISVISPSKITLRAPVIDIEATSSITANSPLNDIKGGGTKIDGKVFLTHDHTLVQPGSGTSGPVG